MPPLSLDSRCQVQEQLSEFLALFSNQKYGEGQYSEFCLLFQPHNCWELDILEAFDPFLCQQWNWLELNLFLK